MFHYQLGPEFKAGATRLATRLARPPFASTFSRSVFAGARNGAVRAIAGWGAVVVVGAVLMANASHHSIAAPPDPAPAVAAAPVAPAPVVAKAEPTEVEVAAQPAPPAPPPVAAKSTQRVDMTPTAAIPVDPAHKLKHKAHKKKAKDVDIPN